MADDHSSTTSKSQEVIAFRIGEQEFCISVMLIREIRSWTQVTPLPHAPPFVLGVVNLRGTVLPIVDLAARMGYKPTEPTPRHAIMVAEVYGKAAGLLVDGVSDIVTLDTAKIQPTPDVASEQTKAFIQGVITMDSRMISLISLESVMPRSERATA